MNEKQRYVGQAHYDKVDVTGKGAAGQFVAMMAKTQLNALVRSGVEISLVINEDGAWLLDMGESFKSYGITQFSCEEGEEIQPGQETFCIERSVSVKDLGGEMLINIEGAIGDKIEGKMTISSDVSTLSLLMEGQFTLVNA